MKIVGYGVLSLILGLAGLFLYQNWSRTISLDVSGNSLSLDLMVWGLVWPGELSASVFALVLLVIGTVIGLVLPSLFRLFFHTTDSYE